MSLIKDIRKATSHAIKGNIGASWRAVLGGGSIGNSPELSGISNNNPFGILGSLETKYSQKVFIADGNHSYVSAYFDCPTLSAIINRKAQSYINGHVSINIADGNDRGIESESSVARKIRNLMNEPNPIQTWKQFEAQNYIYTQLFGYCIVLIQKPSGFTQAYDATAMWNIPPHIVQMDPTNKMFYRDKKNGIDSILVSYGGEEAFLPMDDVFIIKDIMPSFNNVFIPDSRVKTVEMPINNIMGAYESRNILINSRGALGMITNKTKDAYSSIPLKPKEKEDLYNDFKRMYGMRTGQSKIIISSADLDWQSMVLPTKELMLFEAVADSNNRICDTYMFPPELLGKMASSTTSSNMQTATRNLYQDAIIPESEHTYAQWNRLFNCKEHNIIISKCYKHLSVLQPDRKAEAEAILRLNQAIQIEFRNDLVTLNEWRRARGYDPIEDGDVYYSDIKERFRINYNQGMINTDVDDTYVEDDLNPRDNIGDALNVNENEEDR